MKHKKRALFQSVMALILCASMLVGTTFAWFTDSVSSGINTIAAGNLDVELYHSNAVASDEQVTAETTLFLDLQGDPIKWEPGVVSYENLRITNAGDLALAYQLAIATANENFVVETSGAQYGLSQILKVGVVEGGITATDREGVLASVDAANWTTLASFVRSGSLMAENAGESEANWGLVVYWEPGEFDNYWNLNNGKTLSSGETLQIDLGVSLIATQEAYESDAFGTDYDTTARVEVFPVFVPSGSTTTTVVPDAENKVAGDLVMTTGPISASIPAGVQLTAGTTSLTMSVSEMEATNANITVGMNEASRSLDVHIEGVDSGNTVPMEIVIQKAAPKGLNLGNLKLYHVEATGPAEMTRIDWTAAFTAHNQFKYDPATGDIVLYMATFSEVALVADQEAVWEGNFDYSWYTNAAVAADGGAVTEYIIANADQLAGFSAIVGGMDGQKKDSFGGDTIKLLSDINLGDKDNANQSLIFHPIGYYYTDDKNGDGTAGDYYSTVNSFEGTFDGGGHMISNFYQNTWEIKGDYDGNYYSDAMGLFSYVVNGTVKNLTVDSFSSDGEFTPTGVIAAYAVNSAFENIAITNCNPRVYNTGNGGIVGIGGNGDDPDTYKLTFTNITIDNSNIITSLWGSWDTACGGLVGMFRGAGHVYMTNCHVAAQIDVYNDVCGNYQYYWYRYSGMMVGTNKNMTTDDNGYTVPETDKFHAENCTVHFGEWNDYYYCELVANSLASYTHDHQFSRLTEISSLDEIKSGDTWTKAGNFLLISGDTKTCYHIVNKNGTLTQHLHTDSGEETVNGETVLKEDKTIVYLPFNQLFTGYGWGVKHIPVYNGDDYAFEGITILDREVADSVEKFDTKFTGDFLYRVGNANTVSIGSLFAAKDGAKINKSGVYVKIDKVYDESDVSCTFTANADDWTKSTLKFSGTGVVDISIQDYDYCIPTKLHLEVVDAWNTTSAISVPHTNDGVKYDVVLLNDVENASTITISDGYSFYGNGFKLNYTGDGSYGSAAVSYGFVTVKTGGTLDNVDVVCKVFPKSYLYTSEMTADSTGRYPYGYSAIVVSGNSTISNCYVYGARNNIQVGPGNVAISNTKTECGSLANIHIKSTSGSSVTLDDVTTIQYQTASPFDSSAKVLGFGVVVGQPDSTSNPTVKLTGNFVQKNWVTSADTDVSNTYAKSAIEAALKVAKYQHTNSNGETTVNTGIAYLNTLSRTIDDQRTNSTIKYEEGPVSISGHDGYVYSIINKTGNPDADVDDDLSENTDILPKVIFTGEQTEYIKMETVFDNSTERWVNNLTLDLDNISGGTYDFSFDKVKVQKFGTELNYIVKDSDGNVVDMAATITVNQLLSEEYTLFVEDTQIFDQNGALTGETVIRELPFTLYATKTSIAPPKFTGVGNGTAIRTYEESFDISSFSNVENWRPAYAALDEVSVTYWSSTESKVKTVNLSTLNTSGTSSNNIWSYSCDDYTLTITGGQVHTDQSTISPIIVNKKLYFWSANKAFGTGTTSRDIILTYEFKDNNATTTEKLTKNVKHSELTPYEKADFAKGTLTEHSESSGGTNGGSNPCVTPDTLITLADGTQKRIDAVTYEDKLLAWDFFKGEYAAVPAAIIFDHGYGNNTVIKLTFSDGTIVKVTNLHQFFNADLNKFVSINAESVAQYVGHKFAKQNGKTVKLLDYSITEEYIEAFGIISAQHYNIFVEGMLSTDFMQKDNDLFNYFDFGSDMKFDQAKMQADINKYGLYTYADFVDYLTYEQFVAFNIPYMKVAVGKGNYTYEGILDLIDEYLNN